MEFTARVKFIRQAPRKVRKIADLVRGLDVVEALAQLNHLPQKAAIPVRKLIASAAANAEHNFKASSENLFVAKILVNGGATIKRFMPRSQGRAYGILKRTSHIDVVLGEKKPVSRRGKKETAKEAAKAVSISEFAQLEKTRKAEEKKEKDAKGVVPKGQKMAAPQMVKAPTPAQPVETKKTIFRRKGDA
jgi:large subunit ribosomal protein L22